MMLSSFSAEHKGSLEWAGSKEGAVRLQTSWKLRNWVRGLGIPKGHSHPLLASLGTKQLWPLSQLQHLPGSALSDSIGKWRQVTLHSPKIKILKTHLNWLSKKNLSSFKKCFDVFGFDGSESNRIREINGTHLKWDIVGKVQWSWFFFPKDLWMVGKNQKKKKA